MGATLRPLDLECEVPSNTEQLSKWILRVRSKKMMCRRNRRRNFRVEAVLTHALCQAETELREKQINRVLRWQQLKLKLQEKRRTMDDDEGGDGDIKRLCCWEDQLLCPELSSFDDFMSKVNEIKAPLQR